LWKYGGGPKEWGSRERKKTREIKKLGSKEVVRGHCHERILLGEP